MINLNMVLIRIDMNFDKNEHGLYHLNIVLIRIDMDYGITSIT